MEQVCDLHKNYFKFNGKWDVKKINGVWDERFETGEKWNEWKNLTQEKWNDVTWFFFSIEN